ncbi:unnamed protein product [Mytilus coruscus]|uniref:Reverse transcriptase domain-containing protein n=1 Tax=Mytilus coruscus TaxID=42192 RepID=A0A6J8B1D3_MYTCO|nr:unnamed protein product [Mytilus coruscus]
MNQAMEVMGQNTDMPIQGGKEIRPFEMGPQHEGEELGAEAWQEDMVVRIEEEAIEVQGYKLEFYTLPLQSQPPQYPMFNREQKDSLNQEIQKLLEKGAIQPVHQEQTQFLSYDILLTADSKEKLIEARDRTIFLLINLGFVINWEKSKPNPSQQVEFSGFQIDSQEMLFTLPEEKVVKIKQECHQILNLQWVTVRQLAKITGKLVSTMQAIIPANLQCRYLQLLQIKSLVEGKSYETKIQLSKGPKKNWDGG